MYVRHFNKRFGLSIVAVCETWFIPSISSFVAIDGLQVVRGDGSDSFRKYKCCMLQIFCSIFRLKLGCLMLLLCFLLI